MKVLLASFQAISILHGGPRTQLHSTAKFLYESGVTAELFDPWKPINKGEWDIVHIFGANIGTYHLAREVKALTIPLVVSPIVFSLHSHFFVRNVLKATRLAQKLGKGIWTDYAMTGDICSWGRKVLPNTEAEARLIENGYGIEKSSIAVVPNGVDERFAHGDPSLFQKKYGIKDFILNVGHTGHVRKNVLALIEALGQIDHPSVIVGRIIPGEYGDACVREAAKHKQILLVNGLENNSEMLASAYASCDTFVLPSLFETPGIAALEAGLAGAKVVITKYGGTTEYFGKMAEYVEPRSVDSIRSGIISMLGKKKDSLLQDHIRKEYLWQRVAEKTVAQYRLAIS